MDRVFTFGNEPASAGHWVVVAVGEPNPDQRHIGVMHRDRNASYHFLHLAWHCLLRNDADRPAYLSVWVAPNVPAERQRTIAAFCRRVWRKNERNGIPYAFSNPQGAFDPASGAFLIGPSRFGLTCSSFVLAVLHAAGLQVADYSTWPAGRAGDREWQQKIILDLESQQTEQVHIEHLRSEIGTVRFRPEEVAAATVHAPPAVGFQQAEELGRQILNQIRGSQF
ncbi:MAG: hypothetical protein WD894_10650 [Pirellulales bacterium]